MVFLLLFYGNSSLGTFSHSQDVCSGKQEEANQDRRSQNHSVSRSSLCLYQQ